MAEKTEKRTEQVSGAPAAKEVRKERKFRSGSEIFIGNKAFMNYVTGVVMQFNSGARDVSIKARGKYISRAVDVAEVVKNRFIQDAKVKEVKIDSEQFSGENNRQVRVSTIEITLTK